MSLMTLVTEMALARDLTWEQASNLLDAYEGDFARPDPLSELLEGQPRQGGHVFTERDLALAMFISDAPKSRWPAFWHGANPEEAFLLDLRIVDNPGDGSGVPGLSDAALRRELELLSTWHRPTWWTSRRAEQLSAEARARRA